MPRHHAIALSVEAATRRFRVLFVKAADPVRQLRAGAPRMTASDAAQIRGVRGRSSACLCLTGSIGRVDMRFGARLRWS